MKLYKFSFITPEHSPENIPYLLELYDSIINQTYPNWEWVILTNNKCTPQHLPERIQNDFRVKIFHWHGETASIGKLKLDSFNLGTGDILIEADHDDMFTPDCLEKLNKAYQDESVGFVYSDNAVYHMKGEFVPYSSDNGWKHEMYNWKGNELFAMHCLISYNVIMNAPHTSRLLYKSQMCAKELIKRCIIISSLYAPPALICIARGMQSCMKTVAL